ncbi:paralemmin-3 isoform X3 [Pleurodeles waltl]|uniref:paralemmin-3 isoform X3 n=1 Tax=Pleurodeles waltl TaxID=8319 RepID=UPI00370941EE
MSVGAPEIPCLRGLHWKMEETTEYTRRLQAITEKRKLQEEIDKKRRELEEERLKLQQLKRKSLRDRWLMEATSTLPLEAEPSSPVEHSQAYIQHLQDQLASLQSQMSHLENHTFGSAGPVKATAQSLDTALHQSTSTDTSAQSSMHKSSEFKDKGDNNTLQPHHGDAAQEDILHAQANGVMANSIDIEPIAEFSLKEVEIRTSSVFRGETDIVSEGEKVDSLHLEAASPNKMENHREQVHMENGLEVGVSNRNTEKRLEEPHSHVLNLNAPEICLDRLMKSHMVSESTTSFPEGKTCTEDVDLGSTRAHQLAEVKADNGYISLVSKDAMLAAADPGTGLGTVLRAERVMITEDGEEVLVKALEGYVSNEVPHNIECPEDLLKRHTKGIGSGHLGVMEQDSDKTQNTFKGVDHVQAVQEIIGGRLLKEIGSQGDSQGDASTIMGQAIPGKISTFAEGTLSTIGQKPAVSMVSDDQVKIIVEQKKIISLKGETGELPNQIPAAVEQLSLIQEQIPKLKLSIQEPMSNIQESIHEHISDLQASIHGQIPSLQASIQEPISSLQSTIQGHIPSLQASIQKPISNLEASIQGQSPKLHTSIQEPISDIQASIQEQIPNLKVSIDKPISNLQTSIQGQIPNLQASIQEPISSLQASIQNPISTLQSAIHGQIPNLQASIHEPISNVEAFFQGQIPSLQASIEEPMTNLQTSIKEQTPNLQSSLQEPISIIQSSIQEQVPSLQASIQEPISNLAASIQGELPSLHTSIKESILSVESTIEGQITSLQASTKDRISDLHASIKEEMPNLETSIEGQIPSLQASIKDPITNLQTSIQGQIQSLQSSIEEPISSVQSSIQGLIPSIQESAQVQTSGHMVGKTLQNVTGDFGQTFITAHKDFENRSPEQQPLLEEVNLSELPVPSLQHSLQLSTTPKDVLTKPLNTKTQEGPAYTAHTAQASPHRSTDTCVDGIGQGRPKQKTCQCCSIM